MRRLSIALLVCLLAGVFAVPALAQDSPPATPVPLDEIYAIATAVQNNADRSDQSSASALQSASEAQQAENLGFNLLGLFEAISFLVTVMFGIGAVFGVTRLMSAENELSRVRERIETELAESADRFEKLLSEKQAELDNLRSELEQSAERQRAILAQASLAQSLMPLGERQYRAQDYVGALDTYNRALELDPNNLMIHYRLGYVHTQSGNLEQAEYHLSRALEIEPGFAPALAGLGYVFRRLGEKDAEGIERDALLNKAERYMLDALKIAPKLVDEDNESWWGSLGGLYRRRGQTDQAIYAYKQATEVTPHSSYGWGNLALLYMQTNDRAQMMETYKRVEKLAAAEALAEVDNYWGYADLVVSRLALGKEQEADDALEVALEIAPPDSPYVLESLLDTLGRLSGALNKDERGPVERVVQKIHAFQAHRTGEHPASG